ncbi:predicted protein [Naegleria gruberi]|uniref:Predicted protein n=1 Tax=Naegleria gruberi TaxID=5762 RepID=D2W1P1_NAEGR|nr:uncharacterized protein NAEGRDRAFT_75324 [Naegleria gruberi]EFC36997.1 predicted protein [Naegleria gruberi]|eukprot:XP_002669741.1 predicted protein [Naegleria gruberi strain NEG-M]
MSRHTDARRTWLLTACIHALGICFSIAFAIWSLFLFIVSSSDTATNRPNMISPNPLADSTACLGRTLVNMMLAVTCLEFLGVILGFVAMCSGFLDVLSDTFSRTNRVLNSGNYSPGTEDGGYAVLRENWINESPTIFENQPAQDPVYMSSSVDRMNPQTQQAISVSTAQGIEMQSTTQPQVQYSEPTPNNYREKSYEMHYEQTRGNSISACFCCSINLNKYTLCTHSFFRVCCGSIKTLNGIAITILLVFMAFYNFESQCYVQYPVIYDMISPFLIAQFVYTVGASLACLCITCGSFLFNLLLAVVAY